MKIKINKRREVFNVFILTALLGWFYSGAVWLLFGLNSSRVEASILLISPGFVRFEEPVINLTLFFPLKKYIFG